MQSLYPELRAADILVLASPVYIPLPGDMQNFVNRLCPLIEPRLVFHQGRTRARFHDDVRIKKITLVSTGGWWEKENFDTLIHIASELAENAGVEFGGAVLRPHSFIMRKEGQLTGDGEEILDAVRKVGNQLINDGKMNPETLAMICRPLISESDLRRRYNQLL